MVYRGKISPDCLPCRRRKLRCDLQRQGCGQCRRANIVCEGYRDPDQTVFRDETQATSRKVAAREAARGNAAQQRRQQQQQQQQQQQKHLGTRTTTAVTTFRDSVPRLQVSWDVQARDAFFAHYVFGFTRSYDVLATLYLQSTGDSPALAASVDAVSLAFLLQQRVPPGHDTSSSSLYVLARERYLVALRSLGNALASPETAVADATLQAALLLDLYEKLRMRTCQYPLPVPEDDTTTTTTTTTTTCSSLETNTKVSAWMSHIRGAMSLLSLRGTRNIDTYVGQRLASRLVTNLIISCATSDVRFPPALIAFRKALGRFHDNDPKWTVTGIVADLVNLRADMREAAKRRHYGGPVHSSFSSSSSTSPPSSFPCFACPSASPSSSSSSSSHSSPPPITATQALERLADMEKRLDALDQNLPPGWHTTRIWVSGQEDQPGREPVLSAFPSTSASSSSSPEPPSLSLLHPYYDLYGDHFMAQTRNVSRMTRIGIRQIAHNLVSAYPDVRAAAARFGLDMESDIGNNRQWPGPRQRQRRTRTWAGAGTDGSEEEEDDDDDNVAVSSLVTWRDAVVEDMCRAICDSAPQFLLPNARPGNHLPFGPMQKLECYTLIKPLHIAGSISSDERVREWVITTLEYIAEHGGIAVSKAVADILRTEPDTSAWHVYTMLGGYALAA